MIPLICLFVGHKFREKYFTYSDDHMWRYTRYRYFNKCPRCGASAGETDEG